MQNPPSISAGFCVHVAKLGCPYLYAAVWRLHSTAIGRCLVEMIVTPIGFVRATRQTPEDDNWGRYGVRNRVGR